jgi:hypothetical protein
LLDTAVIALIETDYLIVGAGAAGLAFADTLIAEGDADVVIVDRRHAPGGHWVDAYPFVRLHQPSAFYGVNSRRLGENRIDTSGPNAGFYGLASGDEIRHYYQQVLYEDLLPSGCVRFFGGSDYVGDWTTSHAFRSTLTRNDTAVVVRRKVVDTTYLNCSVPGKHTRRFSASEDATVIPVGQLPDVADAPRGFTVVGAGKTAMDACCWLLDNGVDPDRIQWIRPRDAWLLDRGHFQPFDLIATFLDGMSRSVEALAEAHDLADFMRRVEARGMFVRLDQRIEPTMFRGAIASTAERAALSQIERVVRHGHVLHVDPRRIVLEKAEIPTTPREVVVDCTAYGLRSAPMRPTFEPGRITIQGSTQTTPLAALIAWVEANRESDVDKNRLCPPHSTPSRPEDWIRMLRENLRANELLGAEPDLLEWRSRSRLNLMRGADDHMDDPRVAAAMSRWATHHDAALANSERLPGCH